jgi:Fic family protein
MRSANSSAILAVHDSVTLLNNLFSHPYTKIELVQRDLDVSRLTATKYLNALVGGGILQKRKIGRSNYYINAPLFKVLIGAERGGPRTDIVSGSK